MLEQHVAGDAAAESRDDAQAQNTDKVKLIAAVLFGLKGAAQRAGKNAGKNRSAKRWKLYRSSFIHRLRSRTMPSVAFATVVITPCRANTPSKSAISCEVPTASMTTE